MGKHRNADAKLVSTNLRKSNKTSAPTPRDYSAPQVPRVGSTQKNQYR